MVQTGECKVFSVQEMLQQRLELAGITDQPERIEAPLVVQFTKEHRILHCLGKAAMARGIGVLILFLL